FGGSVPLRPKGYRFTVPFPQAQQLAQQADVRVSGVPVGKVIKTTLGADGRAHALIELKSRYAPVHADADALTQRDQQLRGLIANAGATFAQTAASAGQLAAAFRALPTFEQRSQTAL